MKNVMNQILVWASLSVLIGFSLTVAAKTQAASGEANKPKTVLANKSQTPISFTQVLTPDDKIQLGDQSLEVSSKSYYQSVDGRSLKKGVSIFTDGHSAVIRVTPIANRASMNKNQSTVLQPSDLTLSSANGEFNIGKSNMSVTATSEQLTQSHPELFKNTSAFVIEKSLGKGEFVLTTQKAISDDSEYLIHVFDKHSEVSLNLASKQSSFGAGDELMVSASFNQKLSLDKNATTAELIAPDGRRFPMTVQARKSGLSASVPLSFDVERNPGELWKVALSTENNANNPIKRVAELAIDVHEKTANISAQRFSQSGMDLTVTVNKSGRYEIRTLVYQSAGKRSSEPVAIVYSARWFDPGTHQWSINFDSEVRKNGAGANQLVVKQVELLDQSRLAVLQRF